MVPLKARSYVLTSTVIYLIVISSPLVCFFFSSLDYVECDLDLSDSRGNEYLGTWPYISRPSEIVYKSRTSDYPSSASTMNYFTRSSQRVS